MFLISMLFIFFANGNYLIIPVTRAFYTRYSSYPLLVEKRYVWVRNNPTPRIQFLELFWT